MRVHEELQDDFVFPTRVWRILHAEGVYPYHVQRVQHLSPGDFAERLEFCKWLNGSRQLYRYILLIDEAQFTRDGVNNTHDSHVWADENPHATVESNFQQRFSVNLIFVVPCIMFNSEIIPTRCNNCVYSSQWLYSTCFG